MLLDSYNTFFPRLHSHCYSKDISDVDENYLTIIPRARMGYWLRGHEGERNNCFSKIQLVGQKYRDKATLAS